MRIAVFGVGGVGGYFGGRLAQAGEEVIFIARGEHLRALQTSGLRVDSLKGDFVVHPIRATDNLEEIGEVDMVLVTVKAWQVPEAAGAIKASGSAMIGPQTGVVFLGNGVDAPGQLAAVLGSEHVLGGLCQISALIAGPGHIRHVGIEPYAAFGELDKSSSQRAEKLRQAFARAGVKVEVPADILSAMWEKFLFIASISGVGAVTRAPAGVMRSLPETRQMLEQAMQEIQAVARACEITLPEDIVAQKMAFIDGIAPHVTASMQRDIIEGKPSELSAQNGAVVRMGQEAGVPTPMNSFLYNSLLPQELKARGKLSF